MEKQDKLLKYRIVKADTIDLFEMRVNALADVGYTFKEMMMDNNYSPPFIGMMSLAEDSYEGVEALRDIAPELVTEALSAGWSIASSSISTKFVRMVRRKKA